MRYSWALPLLAVPLASAVPDYRWPTVTETRTVTKTSTKVSTTTKTTTSTKTVTASGKPVTVTVSGKPSTVTITAAPSACPTTTVKSTTTTGGTTSAPSSTTSASSSGSTTSSSPATTTTSSINTQEYPTSTALASATGTKGLNDYATQNAGKVYFGTAADVPGPELNDPAYLAVLNDKHEFGQLTPANYMKYEYTEPERGVFNYTGGDVILNIAAQNDQIVRCHNLVWYNQLPNWLTSQTWDNATLISIMTNHITNLVSHWGTKCYAWDVVNEALNDNGTYRSTIWYDTIGPQYLPIAFAAAAAAAPPSVKLYYNDYNVEYPGVKATAAQNIIASIKAQGIRIDGAGLQSHFIIGETPGTASQVQNMQAFAALDVDVAITELDVRAQTLPVSVQNQEQQKIDYYNTVLACVQVQRCVGVTLWDFDDEYSWIPSTFAGQGYADPWFLPQNATSLVKKSAYDGIVNALTGTTPTK